MRLICFRTNFDPAPKDQSICSMGKPLPWGSPPRGISRLNYLDSYTYCFNVFCKIFIANGLRVDSRKQRSYGPRAGATWKAPATGRSFLWLCFYSSGWSETHWTALNGKIPFVLCQIENRGLDNFTEARKWRRWHSSQEGFRTGPQSSITT